MFLNRKKSEDRVEADRQLILSYKKFFGTSEGKDILYDLMNRYHAINKISGKTDSDKFEAIGEQSVIFYILSKANVDVVKYDKILRGEFDHE